MLVKCLFNTGKNLSKNYILAGDTIETDFQINIGELYNVYGVNVWKGTINYLISSEKWRNRPLWIPAELFEIVNTTIPNNWHFKFYGYPDERLNAILGYEEMVTNQKHYDELIEREGDALDIFHSRQREIDKFHGSSLG
jgi:hypothetical protein